MFWLYINYNNIQSVYENLVEIIINFEQLVIKMYDFKLLFIIWYGLYLFEKYFFLFIYIKENIFYWVRILIDVKGFFLQVNFYLNLIIKNYCINY